MLGVLLRSFVTVSEVQSRFTSIYDGTSVPPRYTNTDLSVSPFKGNTRSIRSGVLAYKCGMTCMWDKWGVRHALTVLQVDRCQVTQVKTKESDGYYALQLGLGERPLHLVKKPQVGHFMKGDLPPKNSLTEFKVTPNCLLPVGFLFSARHFIAGQTVDVRGTSKGKGFAGCIKRWHFHRQPATHGNSRTTRAPGSTGQRQDPGRTFPGKKMAGNLGNESATARKILVYKIDYEKDLVYVKGSVPGPTSGVVEIFDSLIDNSKQRRKMPFPTYVGQPPLDVLPDPEKDFFETDFWLHDNVDPDDEEESEED